MGFNKLGELLQGGVANAFPGVLPEKVPISTDGNRLAMVVIKYWAAILGCATSFLSLPPPASSLLNDLVEITFYDGTSTALHSQDDDSAARNLAGRLLLHIP